MGKMAHVAIEPYTRLSRPHVALGAAEGQRR